MRFRKRLLSGLIAGILVMGTVGMNVDAAKIQVDQQIPAEEVDSVYNQEVDSNALAGWPVGPNIYSESGIVMDMDSGAILYAKKIDDQHYPASITKILTAVVALENSQLTDRVKFTQNCIDFLEYGDAHIGMKVGEEISMEDALYGMLLASANEVSYAIANSVNGGYDNFINMMNEKVAAGMGPSSHGSTFGGNPVVCAGANVVVDRMDASFLANVNERAVQLRTGLEKLPRVRSLSGIGLMVGIEFLEGIKAADVLAACRAKGLLVLTAKTRLRLLPPLSLTAHDVEMALDILGSVLAGMDPSKTEEQA